MSRTHISRKRAGLALVAATALALGAAGSASGHGFDWWPTKPHGLTLRADSFSGKGTIGGSVLKNDLGATAVVRHTDPAHGTLQIGADGKFTYVPDAGFKGTDSFTYSATDAVELFKTQLPPLYNLDGFDDGANPISVTISGGAYGSALTAAPGKPGYFYGITDRGPNSDGPNGKAEPVPDFQPAIALFKTVDGQAQLIKKIKLFAPDGKTPYSGRPAIETAEKIDAYKPGPFTHTEGTRELVNADPYGLDPEGLVALADGGFWISDEYGPFIVHFDKSGREIGRLTPYTKAQFPESYTKHKNVGLLPAELTGRIINKGMEGLAVTPDGKTLVGIMQSSLMNDITQANGNKTVPTRIVTVNLKTYETHEYLYPLQDPSYYAGTAVSEITAISATKFLVDERDGIQQPGGFKQLYLVDLEGATDVKGLNVDTVTQELTTAPLSATVSSLEKYVGVGKTSEAITKLGAIGVDTVAKSPYVDLGQLVTQLNPAGRFFPHDKVEGVATFDGGQTLYVANDSDFGISGTYTQGGAWTPVQKNLTATGEIDDGAILKVTTSKLPAVVKTITVTVKVK